MHSLDKIKKSFFVLAIILTIPSIYLSVRSALFVSSGVVALGEILSVRSSSSENGTTYLPTVAYEYNGQSLQFESNAGTGNKNKYIEGEVISILVDPLHPEKAKINSTWELWAGTIVIGGLALLVWLTYLVLIYNISKRYKFIAKIKKEGRKVDAIVERIDEEIISASNSGVTVHKTVFRVYAKGLLDQQEQVFKSDRIQIDPRPFGVQPGTKVVIYVDAKKRKKTYMDFPGIAGSEKFY